MNSKGKSKIKILLILGILFAFLPVITTNLSYITGESSRSSECSNYSNLDNKNLKASKTSGPIHIINNSGWVDFRSDGNCTGSGTYSDPYIIEDLVIDGGGSGNCIWIENSDVYFRIENCTLYNSEGYHNAGIRCSNVNNSQLIINNCSSNYYGIFLRYSNNNTISGNTANNNGGAGIWLGSSINNEISGNTAKNNYHGIYLSGDYSTISGNTVNNNIVFGIALTVCDYNTVSGNTANNNYDGIRLEDSNNNDISGNTANNNYGMWPYGYGIFIWHSDNNDISGNIANNNDEAGIYLYWCISNTISGNTANYNTYGIEMHYSNNTIITGNILLGNDECIVEENCSGNIFQNNNCGEGIPLELIILISSISGGAVIVVATIVLIKRKRKRL